MNKHFPAIMVLVSETCNAIWNERNAAAYSHNYSRAPNWLILQRVETAMKSMHDKATSTKKARQIQAPANQGSCNRRFKTLEN